MSNQRGILNGYTYITYDELQYIIKNNYILPKGSLLNGKTKMDAENYYVQACSMKKLDTIFEKEKKSDVLRKSTCESTE